MENNFVIIKCIKKFTAKDYGRLQQTTDSDDRIQKSLPVCQWLQL